MLMGKDEEQLKPNFASLIGSVSTLESQADLTVNNIYDTFQ
jgi:hypothetical protein